jgi:hypothetical protein
MCGSARVRRKVIAEIGHAWSYPGCDPVQDQGYGLFTQVTLPGGGKLGVYQPRHERPKAMSGNDT